MKKFFTICVLFLVSISRLPGTIDFPEKEKAIIYTNAVKVLEDYNNILNLIGESVVSDVEKTKGQAENFLNLFVNRQVLIYNDLDPAHKLSEFYEAETYTNSLILWYPDGLSVTLDIPNARVSEITSHEANVYSLDVLVKKIINGNYRNEVLNKNTEELTFRIAFSMENKSPDRFRIVGIRNASSNYAIDYSQELKEINSVDLNPEELAKVQTELKTVIEDYTKLLDLLGDPDEIAEDKLHYRESFIALFRDPAVRIYNDITPEAQSDLINVSEYVDNYLSEYPEGIKNLSINSDSARFGKIIRADDGSLYIYAEMNKFFSGNYKGKDVFRRMFPLSFRISFKEAENTYTSFKITGIDIGSVDFYETVSGSAELSKPEIVIKPVTRKGFAMIFTGSLGQTSIDDRDIKTLSLSNNSHSWNVTPLSGFITALNVSYYFNNNFSVRSGIEFNKYSSKFNLNGTFTSSRTYQDINLSTFKKIVEADYDSLVTINYLTVPLLAGFTGGKPGKLSYYAEGGFKVSIPQKARYTNKGYYKYYGYYPNAPSVMKYVDIKELGFYSRDTIDVADQIKMRGFNLSFYASAGISIPLGYYSSITAGPEIIFGISDILRDKDTYTDIFGRSYTHQPTRIRNIGFRISLNYKL